MGRNLFRVGQIVHHQKFDYRGVIVDVDHIFKGTDEWYARVARSRPPRHRPWYRVLVHDQQIETYVAERHLEPDRTREPISHPYIGLFFDEFRGDRYVCRRLLN